METLNKKKDGYSSRFGLLMVMVGGSVGTGNLWRFPRLVCTYGGAFCDSGSRIAADYCDSTCHG